MNKYLVIYKSKYGSTKKYAQWISSELNCPVFEKSEINNSILNDYETIIFGGGLYAGGISGIKIIKDNFNKIQNKKIIVFTCGLADTNNQENKENIKKSICKVFTPTQLEKIKIFNFRGAIDYKKLNHIHKILMSILYKNLLKKNKEELTQENIEFIETYGKKVDFADKSSINELISYVTK